MAQQDDMNVGALWLVATVTLILIVATVIGIQALYLSYEKKVQADRPADTSQSSNLIAEQELRLQRMGWIDRPQGVVAIPIERAMERTLLEQQSFQTESQ